MVFASQNPQASVRTISKFFQIPRSTLQDKLNNKHTDTLGRPYSLPAQIERELAKTVVRFCEKGCAMFISELKDIAIAYAKDQIGSTCSFKASNSWVKRFIKDWQLTRWDDSAAK